MGKILDALDVVQKAQDLAVERGRFGTMPLVLVVVRGQQPPVNDVQRTTAWVPSNFVF